MAATRRMRIQIYVDVLRSIHATRRNGDLFTLYRIERLSGLTYNRLKKFLGELSRAGLLDESSHITDKGYAFLEEVSNKVAPVLHRYGLWSDHF